MCANSFIRDCAFAPFDAVVNAKLADGTEGLVVKRWNAQCRAQLFVELSQVLQMRRERRQFLSVVGEQKLLVARVPQPRELALHFFQAEDGIRDVAVTGVQTCALPI